MAVSKRKQQKRKQKPMKAKPLKKATERDLRVKRARAKTGCAVTASLVIAMLRETRTYVTFEHKKIQDQAERVSKWGWTCLNDKGLDIGAAALREATAAVHGVHSSLDAYIRERGPKGIGHYAVAWISLGFMVDEARDRYIETKEIRRNWNFFSSTVNTFAEMFLQNAEDDRDYEALAGEAAESVWIHNLELPAGTWVKL